MTTVQEPSLTRGPATPAAGLADRVKAIRWIKVWAFIGVVDLGIFVYAVTRWILGGYAKATRPGPDEVPFYMKVSVWGWSAFFISILVFNLYYFVYRPWKRDGRLSTFGLFVLAMCTVPLWDPGANYFHSYFTYNAYTPNLGCYQCMVPGYNTGYNYLAESYLSSPTFYAGVLPWAIIIGIRLIGWWRRRFSQFGNVLGPVLLVLGFAVIFDFVTEALWVIPGLYAYSGGSDFGPVLFKNEYYQLPLVVIVVSGVFYTCYVVLHYFRNDRGESFVERGANGLRGTDRQRTGVRWLALVGGCNLLMLSYNLPIGLISAFWGSEPGPEFKSYITAYKGPGTVPSGGVTAIAAVLMGLVIVAGAWYIRRADRPQLGRSSLAPTGRQRSTAR